MSIFLPNRRSVLLTCKPRAIPANFDVDAGAYIAAVEAADGNQLLEFAVGKAINDFVVGCKADGIWSAIKASCILAGARTLSGALVPLVGTAPTNFNFVSGDYNRKTGLVGNGSTKYLNSNQAGNAAPQNNTHLSSYLTGPMVGGPEAYLLGSQNAGSSILLLGGTASAVTAYINTSTTTSTPGIAVSVSAINAVGFIGCDRSDTSSSRLRVNGSNTASANTSATPSSFPIAVFARNINNSFAGFSAARLAFYSIGESLDLAKLDARVTAMITAFGAAIP